MRHRRTVVIAGVMLVMAATAGVVGAAEGDLDPSFSDDGQWSIAPHPGQSATAYGTLVQPDGKVVVVGNGHDGTSIQLTVARLNKDGSADVSFGLDQPTRVAAGVLEIGADEAAESAYSVKLQPDSKILVAGGAQYSSSSSPFIVRLTKNGALDPTFGGGDGRADFSGSGTLFWSDVAALPDGKVLVLGIAIDSGSTALKIARYTKAGVLDTTFGGGDGVFSLPDVAAEFLRFAIDPDGRPTVAALFNNAGTWQVRVLRLNKYGALDTSFGSGDGTSVITSPSGKTIYIVATRLQSDGKPVLMGALIDGISPLGGGPPPALYLARLTAKGALDTSFGGGDGWTSVAFGTSITIWDLIIQADGRLVVFGGGSVPGMYISRFTKTGGLDTTFGASSGYVSNPATMAYSGAIQPDGRLIAAGFLTGADNSTYLARFLARSTLRKGQSLSARSLLAPMRTVIPKGARFGFSIAASSRGSCVVSRGAVKAIKPGTCTVTVSMTPPKTQAYPSPKTVRSKVVLTITG